MPTYTFFNKKTRKEFTEMMSISEMEEYLDKNHHISQVIVPINIVAGVSGLTHKNDQGWKEVQSKIAEAHPQSAFAQEHRKKSIKEVKTEQAITKHKARQRDKTK